MKAGLPPLHARWVEALLGGSIPAERAATCDHCAMCDGSGEMAPDRAAFFNPATKCCTYLPVLPNFLVGRILADQDPAAADGRATVEARMLAMVSVTPLGLGLPLTYGLFYDHGTRAFGRSQSMRCPHYLPDGGRCGVWRHRNGICATWFCKHDRGALGYRFWQSLQRLFTTVERALAWWCVLEAGIPAAALQRLLPPQPAPTERELLTASDLDGTADPDAYRDAWAGWAGREPAFFQECGHRVGSLDWPDVLNIAGPEVAAHSRIVIDAYRQLISDHVPDRLEVGPLHVLRVAPQSTRVWTYSSHDPLDLPSELVNVLPAFDGRPTADAVRSIAAEHGLRVGADLVRKLADFDILVPSR